MSSITIFRPQLLPPESLLRKPASPAGLPALSACPHVPSPVSQAPWPLPQVCTQCSTAFSARPRIPNRKATPDWGAEEHAVAPGFASVAASRISTFVNGAG